MSAQQILLSKYGVPDALYQQKFCTIWQIQKDFPWFANVLNTATDEPGDDLVKVMVNEDFKDKLFSAFTNLTSSGCYKEITNFDGCYNPRSVRGRNSTSLHAWAAAWDLNAAKEKLAQQETHWSGQFIAIMKAAGIFWGGDWKSRLDSMHFALFNG